MGFTLLSCFLQPAYAENVCQSFPCLSGFLGKNITPHVYDDFSLCNAVYQYSILTVAIH